MMGMKGRWLKGVPSTNSSSLATVKYIEVVVAVKCLLDFSSLLVKVGAPHKKL